MRILAMRKDQGFTLIEILIVVSIIIIIMAGAVPNLLRARMTAAEAGAIGSCKVIVAAQTDYHNNSTPHTYATDLSILGTGFRAGGVPFIDDNLAKGIKGGYKFTMQTGIPVAVPGEMFPVFETWSATAWPIVYASTGLRTFYIDETGVIRGSDVNGQTGSYLLPSTAN